MNLELFIARKIHTLQGENSKGTPAAVRIAMVGIALGLAVMILSVAIIVGFKKEVRSKVIGFGSHMTITNFERNNSFETTPIATSDTLLAELRAFPGIKHVATYATKPGILKTETDVQGIVLKGLSKDYDFSFFAKNLKEGELPDFSTKRTSTEVLLSRHLSNLLRLQVGDSFLTYFVGENIRARKFHIKGIYETGFEEYDKAFVIADLRQVRRLNGWAEDQVSGVELIVDTYDDLDEMAEALYFFLANRHDREGNTLYSRSVKELNPMLFEWLNALDINVVVILVLMLAVAGFTMISGLLIIILERTNMIGILKAMGESNASIQKVFLYVSFFLIGKGMLWGNIIGLSICYVQARWRIVKLDATDYYIDAVPIDLTLSAWALLNICTLLATAAMMLGPSFLITKINPAKTIRFE